MTALPERKTFYLSNNGCVRRKLDAQHTFDFLIANGYQEVKDPGLAELLLFFTCSADDASEATARLAILDLARRKAKTAKIVVGGCLPKVNPSFLEDTGCADSALAPGTLGKLEDLIDDLRIPFASVPEPTRISEQIFAEEGLIIRREQVVRNSAGYSAANVRSQTQAEYEAFKRSSDIVRIAQGCLSNCAYCCIRSATGHLCSRAIGTILSWVAKASQAGQDSFTLTSEDVGAYGLDIGTDIISLLAELYANFPSIRLALMAVNPRWLVDHTWRLEQLLKRGSQVRHAVIPIQSTSDRLLESMQRGYRIADCLRLFDVFRKHGVGVRLFTHLIVGFPGEQPKEVDEAIAFVLTNSDVDYYIYPYNDRAGTISSRRDDKLPATEVHARYHAVLAARDAALRARQGAVQE